MTTAAQVMLIVVAVAHLWFLVLEMFLWTRPFGRRTFGMSAEEATLTAPLAANQGLYNGFLAAGLLWAAGAHSRPVGTFFLTCVLIAGIFGGLTAKRTILFIQAVPALASLVVLWWR
jgi:putative membrane protein